MSLSPYTTIRGRQSRRKKHAEHDVAMTQKRLRPRKRTANRIDRQFLVGLAVLSVSIFVVVYGLSILLGSSLMENARRDNVRANIRAKTARQDITRLRTRMDNVTTMAAIDTWSRSRGFVPPHGLGNEERSSLVAKID